MKAFCPNCHKSVEAVRKVVPIGNTMHETIYYCPDCGYDNGQFRLCEHCHTLIGDSEFELVHDFDGSNIGDFCPSCGTFTGIETPEE